MLTTNDLAKHFGVHKTTIYNWREAGVLPAPMILGKTTVRWRESDITLFEQWLVDRANVEQGGGDPDTVPLPDYSLPMSSDAHAMARERLASACDAPSELRSWVEETRRDLNRLVIDAACLAASGNIQVSAADANRLKKSLTPDLKAVLLDRLPPANAARLEEILS